MNPSYDISRDWIGVAIVSLIVSAIIYCIDNHYRKNYYDRVLRDTIDYIEDRYTSDIQGQINTVIERRYGRHIDDLRNGIINDAKHSSPRTDQPNNNNKE